MSVAAMKSDLIKIISEVEDESTLSKIQSYASYVIGQLTGNTSEAKQEKSSITQNDEKKKKTGSKRYFKTDLTDEELIAKYAGEIEPKLDLEKIIKEQNWTPPVKSEMNELIKEADIPGDIDELLQMLD